MCQSDISAAGRFASDFNARGSVSESDSELKASGGRLGEICEVFCFLENISMLHRHTPRHTSRSREALGLCMLLRRRRRGLCECVGRYLNMQAKGSGQVPVCLHSLPKDRLSDMRVREPGPVASV